MSQNNENFFSNLKSDFPASIIVFLVALPLCLGIALASGVPLFAGIIAGIVGGIIVSLMSGSSLGVSGPAAGLISIVIAAISDLGSFEVFLMAVVLAGVMQVAFGMLKAGVIAYYFPSAVIKGMLSGIGISIIMKQIPHAFGYDKDPEGDLSFMQQDGHNTISELWYMLDSINYGAVIISVTCLLILILWEQPFMKKVPGTKLIQGPLVAVLVGIGFNVLFKGHELFALEGDQMVNIPIAGSISGFFGQFTTPDFSQWLNPKIYIVAATIALVASLETLLCVEATDKLDPKKRVTPTNRELIAQGAGNIFSGLIGGLPVTQVIVRSSANIQSGGKSKASAFIHGCLLLICVVSIPNLLNLIPYSSLAAILLVVGYKLAKPKIFKDLYNMGMGQFIPFVVTVVCIYFIDLLWGIGLGLVVAIIQILWNNFKVPYHFDDEKLKNGGPITLRLAEEVSFLNKARILNTLNGLENDIKITIDATKTKFVHRDVLEILEDFSQSAKNRNIEIEFVGLQFEKNEALSIEHLKLAK